MQNLRKYRKPPFRVAVLHGGHYTWLEKHAKEKFFEILRKELKS